MPNKIAKSTNQKKRKEQKHIKKKKRQFQKFTKKGQRNRPDIPSNYCEKTLRKNFDFYNPYKNRQKTQL